MKVTWPNNVRFEKAELICQEEGARGDKMWVEPDSNRTFVVTLFDGQRIANVVVSYSDMLALGALTREMIEAEDENED